jgi:hypothetical protein
MGFVPVTVPGAGDVPVTVSTTTHDIENYAGAISRWLNLTVQGAALGATPSPSNLSVTMYPGSDPIPDAPFTTTFGPGATGDVQRLYQGLFGRDADSDGLQSWTAQVNAGVPLSSIADAFVASPEFAERYGQMSDAAFIETCSTVPPRRPIFRRG